MKHPKAMVYTKEQIDEIRHAEFERGKAEGIRIGRKEITNVLQEDAKKLLGLTENDPPIIGHPDCDTCPKLAQLQEELNKRVSLSQLKILAYEIREELNSHNRLSLASDTILFERINDILREKEGGK